MEASQSKNILEYLENLRPKIDRKIEEYLPRKVSKEWVEKVFGRGKLFFKGNPKSNLRSDLGFFRQRREKDGDRHCFC
jgi:hypothetical protein